MDEPTGQAHKDLARLTANRPDTRGRIIVVKELKGGTRLISGALLDHRLRESLVAIDENLRSASISMSFYQLLQRRTYRLTFAKRNTDHITILLGPLTDLLNMALVHLDATVR